jgi:hypothetical protein
VTTTLRSLRLVIIFAATLPACGGTGEEHSTEVAETRTPPPGRYELLSQTGLYADVKNGALAEGVATFEPSFKLWSDGAEKRR